MRKRVSFMEGLLMVTLAGMVVLGMSVLSSVAQAAPGNPPQTSKMDKEKSEGITDADLKEIDHFFDRHRDVSVELRKNPELVNDKEWMGKNAEFREWLEKHPKVREEFKAHPREFMEREIAWDKAEAERKKK